jgi:hypothetical protein
MADRIAQRLIAAGASPQRAAEFSRQFAATRPGVTPQKLEDAFDAELGAISQSIWPNTFRPQDLDDAQTIEYFKGIYGPEKYDQVIKTSAPKFYAAKNSSNQIIAQIAKDYENGVDLAETISAIRTLSPDSLGGLTEQDAVSQANTIYNDYLKSQNAAKNFLAKDKYYKANLPDPKLKYGKQADLAAGIIDYKTNPSVEKYVTQKPQEKLALSPSGTGVSPIAARAARVPTGMAGVEAIQKPGKDYEDRLFEAFTKSGATPFFDEVKRRESVKGKTIK